MVKVGVLSLEDAISYGVTGPAGRGSGWSCDVRRHKPTHCTTGLSLKRLYAPGGDSYARYMNRLEEIEESLHIIEQLIDNIPAGAVQTPVKPIVRLPEGRYFQSVETGKGGSSACL